MLQCNGDAEQVMVNRFMSHRVAKAVHRVREKRELHQETVVHIPVFRFGPVANDEVRGACMPALQRRYLRGYMQPWILPTKEHTRMECTTKLCVDHMRAVAPSSLTIVLSSSSSTQLSRVWCTSGPASIHFATLRAMIA